MPGPRAARKSEHPIDVLVLSNLYNLRQNGLEQYWERRQAEEDAKKAIVRVAKSRRTAQQQADYLSALEQTIRVEANPFFSFDEWDGMWPTSPRSRAEFAERIGESPGQWEGVELGEQPMTVRQLVAVAYACNADVQMLLRPSAEQLENDNRVYVMPGDQNRDIEVRAHQWLLWIAGLNHLPGQGDKRYREESSMPFYFQGGLDSRTRIPETARKARRDKRRRSKVSGHEAIKGLQYPLKLVGSIFDPANAPGTTTGWVVSQRVILLQTGLRQLLTLIHPNLLDTPGNQRILAGRLQHVRDEVVRLIRELRGGR